MLAGIIFQLVAISFYILLGTEFILRYVHDRPIHAWSTPTLYGLDKNMKQMLFALAFSSLCIYTRSWYRTIELADGWNGTIIHTQRYFVIMDAMMIVFAMLIMNVFHPGRLLGPAPTWTSNIPTDSMGQVNGDKASAEVWPLAESAVSV
ncbi:uncharacterized protein FIBRA_06767 [Fibroporia radiculosa]|uniref:Uncharacterized protein n=1 Tax=Fibroporia radiculosa TaxID=599839 RepID=J4IBF8_9APHY|nr:uncharacterized protein FIBRA_06767 [Fibroporia radiculosa]CCM04586.1 predicted protein [Fibroporia radiculosa]